MPQILYYEIYNNTVMQYLLFLASIIVCFIVIKIIGCIFFRHFTRLAKKAKASENNVLIKSIKKYLMPAVYFSAVYFNTKTLVIGPSLTELINIVVLAFTTIMAALFGSSIVVLIFNKYWEAKNKDANKDLAIKTISSLLKIVIWVVAVILFLDNMGIKINTLIAGIGVGGIAIAFAAQTILGDIFCFFTIFFDRPFELGDFIVAGEQNGTVEHVGLKTTRLRTLSGELLIFSNTDLTSSRIHNYKTMEQRRVLFTLGVRYDTAHEKLREIPSLMKTLIENVNDTKFARSHFVSYGDHSLNFETAYYILSNDYDKYMDVHQEVNLRIFETFQEHGISFALPTTTLLLPNLRAENNPPNLL